jgi:hypothetical protein
MNKVRLWLFVILVGGALTASTAFAQVPAQKGAPHTPSKIVQGTLKGLDEKNSSVTVEIVAGQAVTLKLEKDALEQLRRTFKKGERAELRLSGKDVVETVAVGTGP